MVHSIVLCFGCFFSTRCCLWFLSCCCHFCCLVLCDVVVVSKILFTQYQRFVVFSCSCCLLKKKTKLGYSCCAEKNFSSFSQNYWISSIRCCDWLIREFLWMLLGEKWLYGNSMNAFRRKVNTGLWFADFIGPGLWFANFMGHSIYSISAKVLTDFRGISMNAFRRKGIPVSDSLTDHVFPKIEILRCAVTSKNRNFQK